MGGTKAPTAGSFGYRQELKRSLTLFDLVVYGLVLISPTAPFAVFGIIFNASDGMVPLVYVVGLAAMYFTAHSYMTMSREFPLAGSAYAYARLTFGERVGFLAGWAMILDYLLAPALIYIAAAVAINAVIPGLPLAVWAIGMMSVNTVVNLRGVETVTRANTSMLMLQIAVLSLFFVVGVLAVFKGTGGAYFSAKPLFDTSGAVPKLVLGAVSMGVLNYLGFDAISTLAEEAKGSASDVARATLLSLLVTSALFVGQSYLASLFVLKRTAFSPGIPTYAAFYDIAQRIGGSWLKGSLSIAGVFISSIASALTAQAAVSRLLFGMARDGSLPRVLAHVHPRHRIPNRAMLLVSMITTVLILFFSHYLALLVTIVSFGALTGFLFVHASVVVHFFCQMRSRAWLRHLVLPVIGFSIICFVMFNMSANAKLVGIGWLAAGSIITLSRRASPKGAV